MANKLTKRKYNNLLTGRNHYFLFGDFLFKPDGNGLVTNRSLNNLSDTGLGVVSAAGTAVGLLGGNLIGGGLLSGVGNAFQSLSGIASAIPGPWGAVASAGLGVLGGVTNKLFGSKLNEGNIAQVEANIDALNSFQTNASDFDTLTSNWSSAPVGMTFDNDFIGKDGVFSHKVKDKANELRREVAQGNAWVLRSLMNNADNISADLTNNLLANYSAFGGPLFSDGGRIYIKPENRGKFTETKRRTGKTTEELTHSKNPITRKRAIFALNAAKWNHAEGGPLPEGSGNTGITRINFSSYKPSYNRGFIPTNMEQLQDSLVARNFSLPLRIAILSSVLHESGGDPLAVSDTGKYRGLLQWGPDRYPNTEDMGELIHYLIESSLDSSSPNWTHGGGGQPKINTAIDGYNAFWNSTDPYNAAMYYNKGYVRPKEELARINRANEATLIYNTVKGKNKKAFGGDLMAHGANFDIGITYIGNGNTHENNPLEGVPMGMDSEGIPNLVEEGEVIFNDYVFSNRLKVPKTVRKKYKLRGTKPLTFADASLLMSKESKERPNDPISRAGLEDSMIKLMAELENVRAKKLVNAIEGTRFDWGGFTTDYANNLAYLYPTMDILTRDNLALAEMQRQSNQDLNISVPEFNAFPSLKLNTFKSESPFGTIESPSIGYQYAFPWEKDPIIFNKSTSILKSELPTTSNKNTAPTWMRYTPAIASGVMSLTDALGLTNTPDYSDAAAVTEAARNASSYTPVKFSPIGNYLTYKPFDRDYYTNKLNTQSAATRRGILNTSGGNRALAMAGLLAADYNAQTKMGDLFRLAEEYNLALRQKVEEFNRATNMYNSEGALKAASTNLAALLNAQSLYFKGALTAAELKQRERLLAAAARSANLSNFINSLGDIGRENFSRNMIISDPSKYYYINANGEVVYKNSFDDLSEAEKNYVADIAARRAKERKLKSKANGGYLTIRTK